MKKKVYISGRISDLPREQYMTMFGIAEQMLRKKGYEVVNPTRFYVCKYIWFYRLLGYRLTLLYNLWRLMQCDLIYTRVAAVEGSQHRELRGIPHEGVAHVERRGAENRQENRETDN